MTRGKLSIWMNNLQLLKIKLCELRSDNWMMMSWIRRVVNVRGRMVKNRSSKSARASEDDVRASADDARESVRG